MSARDIVLSGAGSSGSSAPIYADDVFSTYLYTGTGATQTITNGIDLAGNGGLVWIKQRSGSQNHVLTDTVRGVNTYLQTQSTAAQISGYTDLLTAFNSSGFTIGADASTAGMVNASASIYASWTFRKAPKFFDIVTYTGNATNPRTILHNLDSVPECIIIKCTSATGDWWTYHNGITANQYLKLNTTAALATSASIWGTGPTSLNFTVNAGAINAAGATYVAYLFASLSGISKVGTYTGNGTSLTVACGFSAGARFVLIKCKSTTGDWYVWDTARGIVSANDPHLSLNTTAAEITTDDSVDPDNSGFIVNQVAATNINVTSATYIFLAIA